MYTKNDLKRSRSADGRRAPTRDDSAKRSEFINLELSREQRAECKLFRGDVEQVDAILTEMAEDGYKLTLRYDPDNQCCAAFCFPADDHDNAGFILTGRGSTMYRALSELLFKHSALLERDWQRGARSRREYDDD